jgi:hypothetical protein
VLVEDFVNYGVGEERGQLDDGQELVSCTHCVTSSDPWGRPPE